jgi:hypothetical protein
MLPESTDSLRLAPTINTSGRIRQSVAIRSIVVEVPSTEGSPFSSLKAHISKVRDAEAVARHAEAVARRVATLAAPASLRAARYDVLRWLVSLDDDRLRASIRDLIGTGDATAGDDPDLARPWNADGRGLTAVRTLLSALAEAGPPASPPVSPDLIESRFRHRIQANCDREAAIKAAALHESETLVSRWRASEPQIRQHESEASWQEFRRALDICLVLRQRLEVLKASGDTSEPAIQGRVKTGQ